VDRSTPTFFRPTYQHNQKSEKLLIIYHHSHVRPKYLAYFCPQTKKSLTLINVYPNGIFSVNYISALRGCCAVKLVYALENHQGYLAHTPSGTGVPPKYLVVKIKNLA